MRVMASAFEPWQGESFPEFVVWEFGESEDDDRVYKLSEQDDAGFPTEDPSM